MYAYVHIPFCKSKCTYCDFFSIARSSKTLESALDNYVDAILNQAKYEIEKHSITQWNSIYIGGGTPSLLSLNNVSTLLQGLQKICPLQKNAEITFEVNPCDIAQKGFEYLEKLSTNGINRVSCGIQSLNDNVLEFVKRRSTKAECLQTLELLAKWKQKYNTQFSVDAIAGLPGLSNTDFLDGLKTMLSFNPDHISMYSLMIEEGTELCHLIDSQKIEYDFDFTDEQWLLGLEYLKANGFSQYEVSNFAKTEQAESEHNKSYWRMDDYLGLGCTACGTIGNKRYSGTKNIEQYCNFWSNPHQIEIVPETITLVENLTKEDQMLEFLMMGFRTNRGVDSTEFANRFGQELDSKIGSTFTKWELQNLAKKENGFYALTESGLLQLNKFLSDIVSDGF